jgi:hypothetical protein
MFGSDEMTSAFYDLITNHKYYKPDNFTYDKILQLIDAGLNGD